MAVRHGINPYGLIVRIPAGVSIACPKCTSDNHKGGTVIWQVADERGAHYECDVCSWAGPVFFTPDTKDLVKMR